MRTSLSSGWIKYLKGLEDAVTRARSMSPEEIREINRLGDTGIVNKPRLYPLSADVVQVAKK